MFDKKGYTPEQRRLKVIEHYSNGTNKCAIAGCEATIDMLTIDHEEFNRVELALTLGKKSYTGGGSLINGLLANGLPDVNISIKCMAHNAANKNPNAGKTISLGKRKNRDHIDSDGTKICIRCKIEKSTNEFSLSNRSKDGLHSYCSVCNNLHRNVIHLETLKKAYALYGYTGDMTYMTWSHTNNDGKAHRKYLTDKYGWNSAKGHNMAALLLREYNAGISNYPGLVIEHANVNHAQTKRKDDE